MSLLIPTLSPPLLVPLPNEDANMLFAVAVESG